MHTALASLEVAVLLRVMSVTFILLFHWFELKKLVSVEDALTTQLWGEDKYPCMLMVLCLMENSFDKA